MKTKIVIVVVVVIFALMSFTISSVINTPNKIIACTEEAKVCPDGSAVGRVRPKCEFAECPKGYSQTTVVSSSTQTTVIKPVTQNTSTVIPNLVNTTKLGKTVIINGVGITPLELISDSRCGTGLQCIWAGTVEVRVKIENGNNVKESRLTLGNAVNFLNVAIGLKSVMPPASPNGSSIKPENYYFEFVLTPAQTIKVDNSKNTVF